MRYLFLVLIAISYQLSAQNSFFDNFYPLNSDYRDVAISENNVLIGGTNGALLHSADYGENWKRIYVEGNYTINTVQILDNVDIK